MKVVISGFDPYEGIAENPSHIVPEALAEQGVAADSSDEDDVLHDEEVSVQAVMLPVSFDEAWPHLKAELERVHPDIVIATGLKSAARGILLERCAVNLVDADPTAPTGHPVDSDKSAGAALSPHSAVGTSLSVSKRVIDSDGPAAFWTRLPLRSILENFGRDEIASALSSDAGTFVCNSLFYNLMKWTSRQSRVLSGFVSLPVIAGSAHSQHGLTVSQQVCACRDVVRQAARYSLLGATDETLTA